MRYNNYHKHTHFSNIYTPDCNVHPEEYIKKCVEYGHTNYFTTEHGSFGDIFEAYSLCKQYGIRCLPGIEAYIVPNPEEKDKSNYHIIIIPRTNKARKKINIISSKANISGYYYKPRISPSDLLTLDKEDVYITSACIAGLLRDETSKQMLFSLGNHFKENMFLEVQPHNMDVQKDVNRQALILSEELGFKLIAANDSHYITPEQSLERAEFLRGKHMEYSQEDDFILDFPDYDTMFKRFQEQGVLSDDQITEAINNTLIFDDCEEIDLNYDIKMPTIYPTLTPKERVDLLEKIVNEEFEKVIVEENLTPEQIKVRREGIDYEMKIVRDTNEEIHTADYFLFNRRNVDIAVNKYGGVLTRGGRGSCGSFYINKLLGLTQLDRFEIDLPIFPDRFASTARLLENRAIPDIDYNIVAQEPFVAASRELLGENNCFPMIAYGTMQLGEAFRNVCRSKGLSFDDFNEVAKDIEAHLEDAKWKPYIDEAQKYVGTIVSASVHPCAHLLLDKDIISEYGVVRLGDFLCVMMTSVEADDFKYLKNDYLIVKVWKLISETFKEIGIPIMPARELLAKIKNNADVWDLFKNGITCTLNQVDSDNGMMQAKRYGIKSFEDGALIAAAIRPSFNAWREKFLNHEDYSTGSKALDEVLRQTHHYILFQESLMSYFDWLGISPSVSIGLIKKISKKKIKPADFEKLEIQLKNSWIEKTGSEHMFNETWEMIQGCMAYGFASPHACATSLDMCYGAYLKVNYPYEYYTVCFNNYTDDEERTIKLTNELAYFNIKLSDIKFRQSRAKFSYNKENHTIYKGMMSIKYLNERSSEELYALRDNCYKTFADLLVDIKNKTTLNTRQLYILIGLNYFSEFGSIKDLLKITELFSELYGKKTIKPDKAEQLSIPWELVVKNSAKVTDKQASGVNMVNLLNTIWVQREPQKDNVIDIIKYQNELLGYISATDSSLPWQYALVTNVNTKYGATINAYCLFNGKTTTFKLYATRPRSYPGHKADEDIVAFKDVPLQVGDLIYIIKPQKKNRVKYDNGRYIETDEKVWWLKSYRKANENEITKSK